MIRYIKGTIVDMEETCVVLDYHGMGYRIFMPAKTMGSYLHVGDEVKIHTYMNIREDAMQLFGFLTKDELHLFELLIGVNGIGPKGGLGILSALSADELRFAVLAGDSNAIAKAPGIGKKTAQKLILELKDKLSLEDAFEKKLENTRTAAAPQGETLADAVSALTALGYQSTEALRAVKSVDGAENMEVEALLKAALKYLI